MLNIFVCEDNVVQRRTIVQTIQNTILIEELDMQLVLDAGDPYVLLEKIKDSQNTGIYFLDIDLSSNMNGMKLYDIILAHKNVQHMMLLLSVSKFHMLYETAAPHGCFQQHVVIGTDDVLGIGKPDSLMSGFSTETFLL